MVTFLNIVLAVVGLLLLGIILMRFQFRREHKYLGGVARHFGLTPEYYTVFGLTRPIFGRRIPQVAGELDGRALVIENWDRSAGSGDSRSMQSGFTIRLQVACDPGLRMQTGGGRQPMNVSLAKMALRFEPALSDVQSEPAGTPADSHPGASGKQDSGRMSSNNSSSNNSRAENSILAGTGGRELLAMLRERRGEMALANGVLEYTESIHLGWNARLQRNVQTLVPLLQEIAANAERAAPVMR